MNHLKLSYISNNNNNNKLSELLPYAGHFSQHFPCNTLTFTVRQEQ